MTAQDTTPTTTATTPADTATDTATATAGGCGCGGCGCGGGDAGGAGGTRAGTLPIVARPRGEDAGGTEGTAGTEGTVGTVGTDAEPGDLDLRALPPKERRARALAAVAGLLPGEGVVIAAPHDPARLRELLEAEETGTLGWRYLAEGPQVWRVLVSRETCC